MVEVSLSIGEALRGGKKSIELPDYGEPALHQSGQPSRRVKKLSLVIPPGTRNGATLQLRSRKNQRDEVLVIFRVSPHPTIAIESRGVVVDLALSLHEVLNGSNVLVPTFEEPVLLKIPPGTSSGQEFRLRGKGVRYSDGGHGDLFYRALIKLPSSEQLRTALSETLRNSTSTDATTNTSNELRGYLPKHFDELR